MNVEEEEEEDVGVGFEWRSMQGREINEDTRIMKITDSLSP